MHRPCAVEFEFPSPGSLIPTFLYHVCALRACGFCATRGPSRVIQKSIVGDFTGKRGHLSLKVDTAGAETGREEPQGLSAPRARPHQGSAPALFLHTSRCTVFISVVCSFPGTNPPINVMYILFLVQTSPQPQGQGKHKPHKANYLGCFIIDIHPAESRLSFTLQGISRILKQSE